MASTYADPHDASRPQSRFARLVAAFAMAATAMAPVPVFGQSNGGSDATAEQNTSETSTSSESTDSSSSASKGGTPSLYVLPVDRVQSSISSIVPDRIDDLVRDNVSSDGRVELRPSLTRARAAQDDTAGSRAVAEARKQYRSGIGLVGAAEYEKAVETLSASVATMKKHIEHLREFPVLVDALKNLARAYSGAGYDFDARTTMREFAHLNPDASLDPEKFSEKLRNIYKAEVKKVEAAGTGTLTIEATDGENPVEGAAVFIDGERKGKTPVDVRDIGFGYHYLVVRGPDGERVATKQLQVRGRDKTQRFSVVLKAEGDGGTAAESGGGGKESTPAFYTDLRESLRSGRFETETLKPYLEELSEEADAQVVAWVLMTRDDAGYNAIPFAYRAGDQRLLQGEVVEFEVDLSNLRAAVSTLADRVVTTALASDDAESKTRVALVGADAETVADTASAGESTASSNGNASGQQTAAATGTDTTTGQSQSVDPPPTPVEPTSEDDRGISPWWYVAGSAVLVGGLAAGGAVMLSNPSNPSQPKGFEATVSW